ncbi:MAG: RNA polymerase sigma factor [Planctomycetota bacterium]|nr:RNA polymerase subunit sigma [Planctomycetota bacterium]GIK54025.1 MAG: RNA polymerase sigma factor [Planctomycetota bacterium]HRJ77527.1 sigma-70 family RNA polymerase sigma factor [Planctomycetota bacterium]
MDQAGLGTKMVFERDAIPLMGALYGAAMNLTRNAKDAEDLVQDTFLRAFEKFDQYEQGTNLKAWLHRIMINRFINLYRRKKLRNESASFEEVEPMLPDDSAALRSDYSGARAIETVLNDPAFRESLDERLKNALDSLPVDYRDVLVMNVVMELPYKDIAGALEIPIGTVMSRLSRAKSMMRDRVRSLDDLAGSGRN